MTRPVTGGIVKVVDSRREIAAMGPMPGKTPTNVPKTHPMKQKKRLLGCSTMLKPSSTLFRVSISYPYPDQKLSSFIIPWGRLALSITWKRK
jgi:hypothetical protein